MTIDGENYSITYNEDENRIVYNGSLRLWDLDKYNEIKAYMNQIYIQHNDVLILDFSPLEFLNSSGLSTLCRFIIEAKKQNGKPIRIIGNNDVLWQTKTFPNLTTLWDQLSIEFPGS